jgi:hypothetical protein
MDNNKVSETRFLGMQAGNAELQSRLLDLIRGGLVELDIAPPQYFEEFAARMVDAQLGSIAKRIRTWATYREIFPDTWHEKLLDELGALYIFSKAFEKIEQLSEPLQDELLAQAGVTTRTSDLLEQEGITDSWLVLGQIKTPELNGLTSRRTWLMGKETQKIVLILEYTFGEAEFSNLWFNGFVYSGEAVFYPAAYPLRVAFKSVEVAPVFTHIAGYQTINNFLLAYADVLAQSPWLPQFPVVLTDVTPVFFKNKLFLVDSDNKCLPIEPSQGTGEELVALSGGHPMTVFGEWNGGVLRSLNVFSMEK